VEFGKGAHDLIGVGVTKFDEGVVELGAGLLTDAPGLGELIGAENLAADEDVGEVAACFGHERIPSEIIGRICDVRMWECHKGSV
jgi:hypothetical protein